MTALEKIEANERKLERIIKNNYCCEICGKRFDMSQLQLAHIIAASKYNIKKYGIDVMYHEKMMVLTCSSCNSSVLKNRAANPIEAERLISEIQNILGENNVNS